MLEGTPGMRSETTHVVTLFQKTTILQTDHKLKGLAVTVDDQVPLTTNRVLLHQIRTIIPLEVITRLTKTTATREVQVIRTTTAVVRVAEVVPQEDRALTRVHHDPTEEIKNSVHSN